MSEIDDLSVDELLQAVSHVAVPRTRAERIAAIECVFIPCVLHCKCGAVYKAIAERPIKWYDHYSELEYKPFICPQCITIDNWLWHFYTAKTDAK